MLKTFRTLLLFTSFVVFANCAHDEDAVMAIEKANQMLKLHPDSAISILKDIKDQKNGWSKSQRMRYDLVYAQAQNKAFIAFTSDSIVLELTDYYRYHGSANERMIANYMVGCAYRDLGDAPSALKYMKKAVDAVQDGNRECDLEILMSIHSQMGALYQNVSAIEFQFKEDSQAERLAWKIGDSISALHLQWARACSLYDMGETKQAVLILDSISEFMNKNNMEEEPMLIFPMKISYCIDKRNVEETRRLLGEYEQKMHISENTADDSLSDLPYLYHKGDYYVLVHQPDSAICLYDKLLKIIPQRYLLSSEVLGLTREAYRGLLCAYSLKHNADSVLKFANMYSELSDSVAQINTAEQLLQVQSVFNYSKIQEQALTSERKANKLFFLILVVVLTSMMIGIALWLWYRTTITNERRKLSDASKECQMLMNKMNNSAEELRLVQTDIASFKQVKEMEINALKAELARFHIGENDIEEWSRERSLLQCEIAIHLHQLTLTGASATQKELERLRIAAKDYFPGFFAKISDSANGLSEFEIIFCVLIRFRFVPSEISLLLDRSSQRVTNIKASINKKLFGKSGAKTLDAHILALK